MYEELKIKYNHCNNLFFDNNFDKYWNDGKIIDLYSDDVHLTHKGNNFIASKLLMDIKNIVY